MLRAIFFLGLIFAAYSCGFQKLQKPPLQHINTGSQPPKDGRVLQQAYENIRIHADYSNLESIDPVQKDYIKNQIMPSAIAYYEATLKVNRIPESLIIEASCVGYNVSSELATTGVDADLVIIVAAEYLPDEEFVAGAVPCGISTIDDRPVSGFMLFNLAYLPMDAVTDDQENLSTALHEMAHVLGFDPDFYPYFRNPETGELLSNIIGTKLVNGKNVTYLNVEPLTSMLREYFGCEYLEGAYLEDDGDSGSVGSHFERRVFMNEFMTASSITEPVISKFTLAFLEGSGWYKPNYNMTEPFNWGCNQGCQFLDGSCVDSQGIPKFSEFCESDAPAACSYTARGVGVCTSGSYSDFFANNCPYYFSPPTWDCKNPANQVTAIVPGEIYGASSRCFTGTLVNDVAQPTYGAYCFTTTCTPIEDGFTLTLTIDNNNVTCTSAGPVSIEGYNGQLDCPDPNEFCLRANPTFCEKGCSGRGTCVNNKCECPVGWGGADCALRVFDPTCSRCQNEAGTGCFGDQCVNADQIYANTGPL